MSENTFFQFLSTIKVNLVPKIMQSAYLCVIFHVKYKKLPFLTVLRCFDMVFQRPYRYFSIALKVMLSLSDRYKVSSMIDYRLKFVKNVGFSKIDITTTTINKKL